MRDTLAGRSVRRFELAAVAAALIAAFVVAGAATSALPAGSAAGEAAAPLQTAATCTSAEHTRRARALAAYRAKMPGDRAAYFRKHQSAKLRTRFVASQQARLASLKKAAACRVGRPSPTTQPTTTVAAPTTT